MPARPDCWPATDLTAGKAGKSRTLMEVRLESMCQHLSPSVCPYVVSSSHLSLAVWVSTRSKNEIPLLYWPSMLCELLGRLVFGIHSACVLYKCTAFPGSPFWTLYTDASGVKPTLFLAVDYTLVFQVWFTIGPFCFSPVCFLIGDMLRYIIK